MDNLDRFLMGFWLTCIPYHPVDKKGVIKIGDAVITRIPNIKSQFFYKGYDINEGNMPDPIQRELFDKLPDILRSFYYEIKDDFDTGKYYTKFYNEYNYFKETGRTTWL